MRLAFVFALALFFCQSASAQYLEARLPTAHQIAEGASRSFAELEAKVEALEQENAKLVNELAKYRSQQPTPGNCQCCKCDGCECGKVGAEAKPPKPKICMVAMRQCKACEQWWEFERPRYIKAGWDLDMVGDDPPKRGKLYPYWRICIGDSCEEIAWCPFDQLDAKVQAILDKRK